MAEVFSPIQRFGIDKLAISNLILVGIDFEWLKKTKAEISLFPPGHRAILQDDHGMPVKRILIKDNRVFSDLCIGCASHGSYICKYVYLTMTVSYARGDNVGNLSWQEYDAYLRCVCDYIADTYGIILNPSAAKVKNIELNCNIILSHPYPEYRRVLTLLAALTPKTLKYGGTYGATGNASEQDGEESSDSFLLRNQQLEIIFYDKQDESKSRDKKENEDEKKKAENSASEGLLRIELRLRSPDKVKAAFGTNVWQEINDNMIADWCYHTFEKWYIQKAAKWEERCVVRLKKMLRAAKETSPKNWHHILLRRLCNEEICTRVPVVLDIGQVISAIGQTKGRSYTKSHQKRVIQRAKCAETDVFWQDDLAKLHEILDGFQIAYQAVQYFSRIDTSNFI